MADVLTNGVFTTTLHPPPQLNVDRSFPESFCSAVSQQPSNPLTRRRAPTTLRATSNVVLEKKSWKNALQEYPPSGENPTQERIGSSSSAWETQCQNKVGLQQGLKGTPFGETHHFSHNQSHTECLLEADHQCVRQKEAQNPMLFFGQEVCQVTQFEWRQTNVTKEESIEAMWKIFGKTALFATVSPQRRVSMRTAMEHKYPNVQFHQALDGSLVVAIAEGDLLLEDQNFELLKTRKWAMVRPTYSVSAKIQQAKTCVFFNSVFVSGR